MELRYYTISAHDQENSLDISVANYVNNIEQLILPVDLSECEQIVDVSCQIMSMCSLPSEHYVCLDCNNRYDPCSYIHSNKSMVSFCCPANKLLETIKLYDKAHTIHRYLQSVFTSKRWNIYKHLKCEDCSNDIFINTVMDCAFNDSEKYYKFCNLPKHKISKKWQTYIQRLNSIPQSDCDIEVRQTILDFITTLNDFDFVVNHNKRVLKNKKR